MVNQEFTRPFLLKAVLISAVTNLFVSCSVAIAFINMNQGFGSSDLWTFIFWTIPFVGLMAGITSPSIKLYRRLSFAIRLIVAVIIGALVGFLWTYIVATFLGPWFRAFSFPVLYCWIVGGISAMVAAAGICRPITRIKVSIEILLCLFIGAFAVIGTKPLFKWILNDQHLDAVFVEWKPGTQPLSVDGYYKLTESEISQLKAAGLTGKLNVRGMFTTGEGKSVRAVIVMQHQLKENIDLAQPDGVNVIYIQYEDGWKKYPDDAPTLKRIMHLEKDLQRNATTYMSDLASGGSEGADAFSWR
jgi:hypothetical protein